MAKDGDDEKASGSTPSVFISYASLDSAVAETACEALERAGVTCWMAPRDVTPGTFYADEIVHAIDAARVIVLILSQNAAVSHHVLREVERAASKRHPVVSLRIDKAPLPAGLEYFLNTSHWLDASGSGIERALPKLVEAVQRLVSPASVEQPGQFGDVTTPVPKPLPPPPVESQARQRLSRPVMALCAVIVLGLVGFAADRLWLAKHATSERPVGAGTPAAAPTTPAVSEKSVAVLPFLDMSEKHDQEYFADGMAEEIIDLLARVPDLRVPARTSSFYFKGKSTKIPDIARELGVAHVLEGSIRRSGDRLRVTAQLVRSDNGYHLWSETYDRDAHDVFKVQDDIANSVVQALQITLMGGPLTRQKGGTENLEAYQLYLRGLSSMWHNTRPSLTAARDYFDQAIKLDPNFGLAWAEQSRDALFLTENGVLSPNEGFEKARQLAQHALRVSPNLAEAHNMLAYVYRVLDWNWSASDAEVRQALALDPTNPTAWMFAGALSYDLGHWDDAERQLRMALVRDPLFAIAIFHLGTARYSAGRFADAEATYRKLIKLDPGFSWTHLYLGKTLLAEGNAEAALAAVRQEADEDDRLDYLPIVLQAAGHQTEADEALEALIRKFGGSSAYMIAATYAYRDDHDLALEWLERAYKQKDPYLVEIVGEPLFKNLANDRRYKAFLRKMNLPE